MLVRAAKGAHNAMIRFLDKESTLEASLLCNHPGCVYLDCVEAIQTP